MQRALPSLAAIALLLTMGAGCFGLGGKTEKVGTGGVYLSPNGGATWIAKSQVPGPQSNSNILGVDVMVFEQDPQDPTTMYIGTRVHGMFMSLDGGDSWMRPEVDLARTGMVLDIEVDPRNICTFYVLKLDRVMKTETCGRTFDTEVYVQDNTDETLSSMALDWYAPDTLWLGTSKGDVQKTVNGGESWFPSLRMNDGITSLAVSNADSRIVLVGTVRSSLFRTTDSGATWVGFEDQLKEFKQSDTIYNFSQTKDGSTLLMSGEHGLLLSSDSGFSWKSLPLVTSTGEVFIRAIAVAPENGGVMYYATDSTFYKTTSGGSSWTTAELPTTYPANALVVDALDVNKVWVGLTAPLEE